MSTQANTYVVVGVKLPFPKGEEGETAFQKYEAWMDSAYEPKKSGMVVLFDGRNGEYIIAGHVLDSTPNWEGFDEPVDLSKAEKITNDVKRDLKAHFNITDIEVKTWVVTHYR